MPEYKPLVIEVEPKSVPAGVQTKWQDFTAHMPIFTRDIITPAISLESGNVGAIVSGVPTAYARANLFNLAMNYGRGNNETALNLNAYYEQLAAEWRGFIACIALDHQRIEVERVRLAYSDGKDFKAIAVTTGISNGNVTEVSGVSAGTEVITEFSVVAAEEGGKQQNSNPFMPGPRNRNNQKSGKGNSNSNNKATK
jgi:hypothetical protein